MPSYELLWKSARQRVQILPRSQKKPLARDYTIRLLRRGYYDITSPTLPLSHRLPCVLLPRKQARVTLDVSPKVKRNQHQLLCYPHSYPLSQNTLSIPQVCMLLPQVLCHLITTTKPCSIALMATRNWAEVKSLSGPMNSVLMADAIRVAFEAFCAAELGTKEALWKRWLLESRR